MPRYKKACTYDVIFNDRTLIGCYEKRATVGGVKVEWTARCIHSVVDGVRCAHHHRGSIAARACHRDRLRAAGPALRLVKG